MKNWYFTFGAAHKHHNNYVIIESTSRDLARKRMFEIFGTQWAFQYDEQEWNIGVRTQAQIYGYKELDLTTLKEKQ